MGSNASIMLQQEDLQTICQETGFTAKQVQRLYSRFKTLDKRDCGYLTREDLLCIPEVKDSHRHFSPSMIRTLSLNR